MCNTINQQSSSQNEFYLPHPMHGMTRLLLLVTVALLCVLPALAQEEDAKVAEDTIRPAIVKIHATIRQPDMFRPWGKQPPSDATGSGVVIEGNRIITNAHVVRYASQVYVQPYQSADRLAAEVEAISYDMDLAILKLEDESFFKDRTALEFHETFPKVKQVVNAYGYPTGGEELSVTEGIVSRIEMAPYNNGALGLVVQVDAALNPGNSGGAAMIDGKIAGIVRSGIPSAENIGFLIPGEEVLTFLSDVEDGKYDGKYRADMATLQTTDNPALREKLGLDRDITGIMVTRLKDDPDAEEEADENSLQEWDVITHIAGENIDNDGQVQLTDNLRVSFQYYIDKKAKDGKLPLTVLRNGESKDISVDVTRDRNLLLPSLEGAYPRYYIYGPLAFTQGTRELVASVPRRLHGLLTRNENPLFTQMLDKKEDESDELVVVSSPMFPHRITKGYDNPMLGVVSEVNGVKIKNLEHLAETLENSDDEFIVIRFAGKMREHLVFKRDDILEVTEGILTDNGIRYRASKDLRKLLKDDE